jgi:hypothetical protein
VRQAVTEARLAGFTKDEFCALITSEMDRWEHVLERS